MPEDTRARITIRVDPQLRKRARAIALQRDETLQSLAERALVTELEVCDDEASGKGRTPPKSEYSKAPSKGQPTAG